MEVIADSRPGCPAGHSASPRDRAGQGDSKTAGLAAGYVLAEPGSRLVNRFAQLRQVLRSEAMRQSGVEVAPTEKKDPTRASIFFLNGEEHRRRRAAIARFFTPKAIATRHMRVILENTRLLTGEFRASGRSQLDDLSLRMAASVIAEIVGLPSHNLKAMSRRIEGISQATMAERGGLWKLLATALAQWHVLLFYLIDVRPAIAARRAGRQEDVISRLLDEGRSNLEVLVECSTFGMAGMTTTREFIVVAAWHMLEDAALRQRFTDGDEADQTGILTEILRLEPVASMIWRTTTEAVSGIAPEPIPADIKLSLDIRAANLDESEVGPEPHRLDPERARRCKANGAWMSFGDGEHFCPGWQVALVETRVFLDGLLRVPGVRLVRAPDMHFVPPMLMSYELRNAVIACDH
jgi:cytochrome P450